MYFNASSITMESKKLKISFLLLRFQSKYNSSQFTLPGFYENSFTDWKSNEKAKYNKIFVEASVGFSGLV